MKTIGKVWEISQTLKVPFQEELSRQLQGYRATPHSSTGKSPAELAGKISYSMNALGDSDRTFVPTPPDREQVEETVTKQKNLNNRQGKNVRPHNFQVDDQVIVRLGKSPLYEKTVFTIIEIKGNAITARSPDGQQVLRNAERFKHYIPPDNSQDISQPNTQDIERNAQPSTSRDRSVSPEPPKRLTRSKGPVEEEPWIQKPKERSRKQKS